MKQVHLYLSLFLLIETGGAMGEHATHEQSTSSRPTAVEDFRPDDPALNIQFIKTCQTSEGKWAPEKQEGVESRTFKNPVTGQVKAIFEKHCLECHAGEALGGSKKFPNILSTEDLIQKGFIVPGNPKESILYKSVSGPSPRMPATNYTLNEKEQDLIKQWIEAGAESHTSPAQQSMGFVSEADKEICINEDLKRHSKFDKSNMRYFTFTHLYNAGKSEELKIAREALSMLINSLSTKKDIVKPEPIDSLGTIFRIDLRDYGLAAKDWDRVASLNPYGNIEKAKVYEKLVCATRTDGCDSPELSQKRTPFVRGDWFIFNASRPPLYHDLLKLPGGDGVLNADKALEQDLGVHVEGDLEVLDVVRAGTMQSGVADSNRLVERHDSNYGYYWKSFDTVDSKGEKNIFDHPFGSSSDASEIIYSLPNGLQGYMIVDSAGRRLDEADIQLVRDPYKKRGAGTVTNGISCMNCHNRGINPIVDKVRAHVEGLPGTFDKAFSEKVKAAYPPAEILNAILEKDQTAFERKLAETQYVKDSRVIRPVPVYKVSEWFEGNLDLNRASAELGLTPENLLAALKKNPELRRILPLEASGQIERTVFNERFGEILKILARGEGFVPRQMFTGSKGESRVFRSSEAIGELEKKLAVLENEKEFMLRENALNDEKKTAYIASLTAQIDHYRTQLMESERKFSEMIRINEIKQSFPLLQIKK